MYCPKCGTQLDENVLFCSKCGEPVKPHQSYLPEENRQLFSTKGRISRSTFWLAQLYCLLLSILFLIPFINILAALAIFLIATSAIIKRLQDMDQSPWFVMLILIPLLGSLILTLWCGIVKGTDGPNKFGNDPLRKLQPL